MLFTIFLLIVAYSILGKPIVKLVEKIKDILGVLDDAAVAALVIKNIHDKITPEIEVVVEATLDEWFRPAPAIC